MESEIQSRNSYCDGLRTQIENLQRHEVQHEQVVHEVSEVQQELDRAHETNASLDTEVQTLKYERTQAQEKAELLQSRLQELSRNEQMVAHDMQVRNSVCLSVSFCLSACLFLSVSFCLFAYLSLTISASISVSVYLSISGLRGYTCISVSIRSFARAQTN